MIKFVHKRHHSAGEHVKQISITYSAFDIILSVLLISLVAFYIYNYLEVNLDWGKTSPIHTYQPQILF